jgi:hypothetical protein
MRDTDIWFATTTSRNVVDLPFPYQGGSTMELWIRKKKGAHATEAYLVISK